MLNSQAAHLRLLKHCWHAHGNGTSSWKNHGQQASNGVEGLLGVNLSSGDTTSGDAGDNSKVMHGNHNYK